MNPIAQCILLAAMMGLLTAGALFSVTESKCRLDDVTITPGFSDGLYNIHLSFSNPLFPNIESKVLLTRRDLSKEKIKEYGDTVKKDEMWRCFVHTGFPISVISHLSDTHTIQYLAPLENPVNLRVSVIVCIIYVVALIFILRSEEAQEIDKNNNKLNKKTNID